MLKPTETRPHRIVTAVADSAPETGADGKAEITQGRAIFMANKASFWLYVQIEGTDPTVTLTPYWWDEAAQAWFADSDQAMEFEGESYNVVSIEARGRYCQVRATALTGDDVVVTLRYMMPIHFGV